MIKGGQEWRATFALSIVSVILALAVSLAIIALHDKPVGAVLDAFIMGAFGDPERIASTISKMIPLLLAALGWIVAFSAGRFNIGLEGQIIIGGIAAATVGLTIDLPPGIHLAVAMLAALVGGALWAGIAAWLWVQRNVNEIISTLLLNFVAIQLLAWVVVGPLQEPTASIPASDSVPSSALWPVVVANTPLTWVVVVVVVAVAFVAFMPRTVPGLELQLTGQNEQAARYVGVQTRRRAAGALILSGVFPGLAGGALILGTDVQSLLSGFSANFGFAGIIVALLARNNPLGSVLSALLFAVLLQGGGFVEATEGVPSQLVLITIGLVMIFAAAAEFLIRRWRLATAAAEVKVMRASTLARPETE